jgi:hypothetical protein
VILALTDAEKYTAAAYLVVFLVVLVWIAIIAAKLTRLQRELGELAELARKRDGARTGEREKVKIG